MPKTAAQMKADEASDVAMIREYLTRATKIETLADIVPIIREAATWALARFEADMAGRGE